MEKKLTGLEKQDAFLTNIYSLPWKCPVCDGNHTLIEARGGSTDWVKDYPLKCPVTGEALVHGVSLWGEDFFTKEPPLNL